METSAMNVFSIPSVWHVKFTYQLLGCWCVLHQRVRRWKNNLWSGKNVELQKFIVCSFAWSAFQINRIPTSTLVLEKESLDNLHRSWTTRGATSEKQTKVPDSVQWSTSGVTTPLYCSYMCPSCFWIACCCYFVRDNMACRYEKNVHF